jgi:hypothetical protein
MITFRKSRVCTLVDIALKEFISVMFGTKIKKQVSPPILYLKQQIAKSLIYFYDFLSFCKFRRKNWDVDTG